MKSSPLTIVLALQRGYNQPYNPCLRRRNQQESSQEQRALSLSHIKNVSFVLCSWIINKFLETILMNVNMQPVSTENANSMSFFLSLTVLVIRCWCHFTHLGHISQGWWTYTAELQFACQPMYSKRSYPVFGRWIVNRLEKQRKGKQAEKVFNMKVNICHLHH